MKAAARSASSGARGRAPRRMRPAAAAGKRSSRGTSKGARRARIDRRAVYVRGGLAPHALPTAVRSVCEMRLNRSPHTNTELISNTGGTPGRADLLSGAVTSTLQLSCRSDRGAQQMGEGCALRSAAHADESGAMGQIICRPRIAQSLVPCRWPGVAARTPDRQDARERSPCATSVASDTALCIRFAAFSSYGVIGGPRARRGRHTGVHKTRVTQAPAAARRRLGICRDARPNVGMLIEDFDSGCFFHPLRSSRASKPNQSPNPRSVSRVCCALHNHACLSHCYLPVAPSQAASWPCSPLPTWQKLKPAPPARPPRGSCRQRRPWRRRSWGRRAASIGASPRSRK